MPTSALESLGLQSIIQQFLQKTRYPKTANLHNFLETLERLAATLQDGSQVRINFVGRLEFQDGKRREVTQDYHGRAAVHLHGLVFAEEVGTSQLPTKLSATVPPEGDPLRGYVLDGQPGRTGSGLPRQEEASHYDPARDAVHLQHRALDKHLGIRGYSPEVLDVLKCHQDVQVQRGTGLMLKYAATYLPKFSDGPDRAKS